MRNAILRDVRSEFASGHLKSKIICQYRRGTVQFFPQNNLFNRIPVRLKDHLCRTKSKKIDKTSPRLVSWCSTDASVTVRYIILVMPL
jgi:hypothetical protein